MRIDSFLHENAFFSSRQRAQEAIKAGVVFCDGKMVAKASFPVPEGALIEVKEDPMPYVGRGAVKLLHAFTVFPVSVEGLDAVDVGASTGGFTEILLQKGAAFVCAVDVGHAQLADSLRSHPNVLNMEGTDIRSLAAAGYRNRFDFASVDVSFISLTKIFPALAPLLRPGSEAVCLVKPQFETGRSGIGKNGVVKSEKARENALRTVEEAARNTGFSVLACEGSPILGREGNMEYLLYLRKLHDII